MMWFSASGRRQPAPTRLLTGGLLLMLVLVLTLTLNSAAADEEELPEPEALVSYPDLYPAADGSHQSSYGQQQSYGYQPPSYGYQQPSYGYQQPSYGYGHKDDCGDLDLLGVLAGGGALAALAVYILVTQAMMMRRRSFGRELDEFEAEISQVFRGPPQARNFADTTVNVTCQVAEWIAGDGPTGGMVEARDGGSDCFSGLVGAAAGFAALGALIAYALYLAAQAMARSFSFFDGIEIDEQGLSLVAQMALLFLQQDEEPACLPHGLCRLNQRARSVGPTHYLATKLASLPAGWFLGSRMAPGGVRTSDDRSFLEMCRGITITESESACDRQYPTCGSLGR